MSSALAITDVRHVQPGVLCWSAKRGYAGVGEDGGQLEPVGGVVVAVLDVVDRETGEAERAVRTIDPYRTRPRLTWHVLVESEVNRETLDVAGPGMLGTLYRRLCEEVAMDGHKRRRRTMPEHVDLAPVIHVLASLL